MKKIFLALILGSLFSAVYADDWTDGGPARMLALGRIEAVLPGSTSVFDLYEQGFASAIFEREKTNIISLAPQAGFTDEKDDSGNTMTVFKMNAMDEDRNFINYWISDNDEITFKPYYFFLDYNRKRYTGINNSETLRNMFAAEAHYSRRFTETVSAAAMARYAGSFLRSPMDMHASLSDGSYVTITSFNMDSWKLEYMVDLSFKLSGECMVSLSAGHKQGLMDSPALLPGNDKMLASFLSQPGYSGNEEIISDPPMADNSSIRSGGFNIGLGVSYKKDRVMESVVSLGVILGKSFETLYSDPTMNTKKYGTGITTDIKCRYHAGDNYLIAFSAQADIYDYTYNYQDFFLGQVKSRNTDYNATACAGVSYIAAGLAVPLELFAVTGGFYDKYAGIRGGLEYEILKGLRLRAGMNWPFLIEKKSGVQSVFDIEGTGGLEIRIDPFILGLAAGYTVWRLDGLPGGVTSSEKHNWEIRSDIKIPLGF